MGFKLAPMRQLSRLSLFAFLLVTPFAFILATPLVGVAIETGEIAILIQDAPIQRDNTPAGILEQGTRIEVQKVDGLRLLIDKPVRGTISVLTVVPISEAEAFFTDRLSRDPNDALMLALRGVMRYQSGKTTDGMNDLNEAIGLRNEDGSLHYLRGKVLLSAEKLSEARRDFVEASSKTRTARHFVAKGNADLRQRIHKSAETAFNNAKKLDPEYAPAYLGLAAFHLSQKRPGPAIVEIDKAIEKAPYLFHAYALKGQAFTELNKLDEAVTEFDKAVEINLHSIQALLGRGLARYYLGKRELAEADFDAADQARPTSLKERMDRAQAFIKLGRHESAIADLESVIAKAPQSFEARNLRAQALEANGLYEPAIEEVEILFQRVRRNANAQLSMRGYLASLHTKNKDFGRAEIECNRMLEQSPSGADPKMAFARLRIAQGKIDEAIELFDKAIEAKPRSISGYSGRAMAYEQRGEYEKMIKDFQTCAELDKDNPLVNNNLAWIRATCPVAEFRDGAAAVKLAQAACEAHMYRSPGAIDTLAAAHAEAGNFEEAIKQQKMAVLLAIGDDIEKMKTRISLYEKRQPYREDNRKASADSKADDENATPEKDE